MMNSKLFNRIFYTFIIIGVLVGGVLFVYKDRDIYVTTRTCVESSGPSHVDPRTGDGPECDRYAPITDKKPPQQSFFWGGLAGAFVGGWIGLFVAMGADSLVRKKIL